MAKDKKDIKNEDLEEVEAEVVEEDLQEDKKEKSECDQLRDTLARLQADFENYRNRMEKEKSSIYDFANQGLISKLLPVIDNFDRAIASGDEEDSFVQGMVMIRDDLMNILEKEGLTVIDSDGEKFDPNLHHAVFAEESDEVESEHIIETLQKGYKLKDRVIRPAMVRVAK